MAMFSKIKAVKNLHDQAKQMQAMMETVVVEGSAAWGKVKVKINGNQQALEVNIEDEMMKDKSKLQDALRDALNDAVKKSHTEMAGKMKDMGGLDLLKGFGQNTDKEKT